MLPVIALTAEFSAAKNLGPEIIISPELTNSVCEPYVGSLVKPSTTAENSSTVFKAVVSLPSTSAKCNN